MNGTQVSDYNEDIAMDDGERFKLALDHLKKSNVCSDYFKSPIIEWIHWTKVLAEDWLTGF